MLSQEVLIVLCALLFIFIVFLAIFSSRYNKKEQFSTEDEDPIIITKKLSEKEQYVFDAIKNNEEEDKITEYIMENRHFFTNDKFFNILDQLKREEKIKAAKQQDEEKNKAGEAVLATHDDKKE